ncbi:hypothetical protein BU25DRAFT_489124 [Macroventuria anomochaeta]|uniref:Uncharacterized protein n=1 Tax=Macroventuria anomochaeta TaxID=301207 RepID=A0ACB6S9X9_9PLEO|nr:uncharacterized protein BU25DRAFT_489124 [Macroventuria anomochaeta]KAF2630327.1 hypothetical protein BU25DRAFT_489124 [Macroventuria anomochaeta]
MPPVNQPWRTPTVGVQAPQIASEYSTQPYSRVDGPDRDGRKRIRITPIVSAPDPWTRQLERESAGPGHALDMGSIATSGTWGSTAKQEAEDSTIVEDLPEEEEYYSDVSNGSPDAMEKAGLELEEGDDLLQEAPMNRPSKLGTSRVTEIINECIEMYAQAWRPGKDKTKPKDEKGKGEVPVVYDPVALWEEAEAAGQREELAEKYDMEAEYYRQRLDKLCDEIFRDPGDTVAGVKMKCRNLEVTVELLERAGWLALIYKEPPKDATDDDSREEDHATSIGTAPSTAQPVGSTIPPSSMGGFMDLGTPPDTSDSEDDVTPLSDPPITPAKSNNKLAPSIQTHLLSSDPVVVNTIETPGPAVAATTPTAVRSRAPLGDAPEHASMSTVSRWNWSQLKDTQDRKRIVSKVIHELSSTDREMIRQRLQKVGRANVAREIPMCVALLLRGDKKMPGILPQDQPKIVTLMRLFLCWWLCGNYFVEEPSGECLEELASCLKQNSPDPTTFCDYLDTVLNTTFSLEALSNPTKPSQAEIIEISDDDEPLPPLHKQRKSNVDKPGSLQKGPTIVID